MNERSKREMIMKKGLLIFSILLIIIIGIISTIYLQAVKPVKTVEDKALNIAKEEAAITEIEDFNIYHGEEVFYIIQGKDQNGTQLIVWIPEEQSKPVVKKASDGLSKQEAINKVMKEVDSEIISVKLGMEEGIPLWEIHSRTSGNLLNYHYIEFETGEWLKKIENL